MKRFLNTTVLFTSITALFITAGFALGHDREGQDRESVQTLSAKVTMEEAIQTAKTKFPGRVVEAELESEDGALVYEVKIVNASGNTQEIEIDAQSGEILVGEHENETDNDETQEAEQS